MSLKLIQARSFAQVSKPRPFATTTRVSFPSTTRMVMPHGHLWHGVGQMPSSPLCFASGGGGRSTPNPYHANPSSSYVPVYVMLPLDTINMSCDVSDPYGLFHDLQLLKFAGVDGVMVDCWWGIVEGQQPYKYNWSGYKDLFEIIKGLDLKLQVVMSFHRCGGNVGDDVIIPLPKWVTKIGNTNPDIYFTDKEGRRNDECLTWGIDQEPVLLGRTAIEVYVDFMRSFRDELYKFFEDGTISEVQVGLGPCGELRYPSYPREHGWKYPGIGEFQSYDQYLMKKLRKEAEAIGRPSWGNGPEGAGSYNSSPNETAFFRDFGGYNSYHGMFFLNWYSKVLIDHADMVMMHANQIFKGTPIAAKVAGVHWWFDTNSHAAELTAGYYNSLRRDGYIPIAAMLKKNYAQLNFTCAELCTSTQKKDFPDAKSDPEALIWEVRARSWNIGIPFGCENALPCFDKKGYNQILKNVKQECNKAISFTYLRLCRSLFEEMNFTEFMIFVKKMHGEEIDM